MQVIPIETSRYGPVTPAYQTNLDVIDVGFGPVSKVIGSCLRRHQGSGQCWGTFESKWVDQKDTSISCLMQDNLLDIQASYKADPTNQVKIVNTSSSPVAAPKATGGVDNSYGTYSSCPQCAPARKEKCDQAQIPPIVGVGCLYTGSVAYTDATSVHGYRGPSSISANASYGSYVSGTGDRRHPYPGESQQCSGNNRAVGLSSLYSVNGSPFVSYGSL